MHEQLFDRANLLFQSLNGFQVPVEQPAVFGVQFHHGQPSQPGLSPRRHPLGPTPTILPQQGANSQFGATQLIDQLLPMAYQPPQAAHVLGSQPDAWQIVGAQ